jgi:hypothetical protein
MFRVHSPEIGATSMQLFKNENSIKALATGLVQWIYTYQEVCQNQVVLKYMFKIVSSCFLKLKTFKGQVFFLDFLGQREMEAGRQKKT